MKKNKKGITLVILVITIVVMLILAGITLNIILNSNNGILKEIENSKKIQAEKLIEETTSKIMSENFVSMVEEKIINKTKVDRYTILEEIIKELEQYKNKERIISEISSETKGMLQYKNRRQYLKLKWYKEDIDMEEIYQKEIEKLKTRGILETIEDGSDIQEGD